MKRWWRDTTARVALHMGRHRATPSRHDRRNPAARRSAQPAAFGFAGAVAPTKQPQRQRQGRPFRLRRRYVADPTRFGKRTSQGSRDCFGFNEILPRGSVRSIDWPDQISCLFTCHGILHVLYERLIYRFRELAASEQVRIHPSSHIDRSLRRQFSTALAGIDRALSPSVSMILSRTVETSVGAGRVCLLGATHVRPPGR